MAGVGREATEVGDMEPWDDIHVHLLDPGTGQLLREHLRTQRGWHRIADDDRPARTPPKTLALLAAAKRAGPRHLHRLRPHPPP